MTDETYTFEQTRVRLEGILVEVRKKDTSLEQSLELLEEGVRLLNQCNELIDQTAWRPVAESPEGAESSGDAAEIASSEMVGGVAEAVDPGGQASAQQASGDGDEVAEAEELPDDERD
jgi:exodeoxyribonuclease VII small subunit